MIATESSVYGEHDDERYAYPAESCRIFRERFGRIHLGFLLTRSISLLIPPITVNLHTIQIKYIPLSPGKREISH